MEQGFNKIKIAGIVLLFLIVLGSLLASKNQGDFHLADPNKLNFYETVHKFPKKEVNLKNKHVVAGIIPHHLLAADLIAEFFSNFADSDYDTVVLIGPNHFLAGKHKIITSAYDWETPYGILECNRELLNRILKLNGVAVEEKVFENEHSITSIVAFIKKHFPKVKFLPIILKPDVNRMKAEELAEYLFELAENKKILLLASVDFSHYKDNKTAQNNDKISIKAIQNFSFDKIYGLDIDSPASIYTLLKFSDLKKSKFKLLDNSNSAILANKLDVKRTTSYVTGYFLIKNRED